MNTKGLALSMGLGLTIGAVGILMMSKTNPTRKLASTAAYKIEDAANNAADKLIRNSMH